MRWFSGAVAAAAWVGSALFSLGLWIFAPHLAKPPLQAALVIAVALVPLVLSPIVTRAAPRNPAGPLLASAGFAKLGLADSPDENRRVRAILTYLETRTA